MPVPAWETRIRSFRQGVCLAVAALALGVLAAASALAQAPAPPAAPEARTPPPLREVQPAVYYLKNSNGELVPVPDIPFEQFERLFRLDRQLDRPEDAPPRFSVQRVTIQATEQDGGLACQADLELSVQDTGWVRVPVRFDRAVLREAPQAQGAQELFFTADEQGRGYVAWIRGGSPKKTELKLKFLQRTEAGPVRRMEMELPKCTSSQFVLQVPGENWIAEVSAGHTALKPQFNQPSGKTELTILGAGGPLQLSWRQESAVAIPSAQATAHIVCQLEGDSVMTATAWMKVRSLGKPLDRFHVVIPAGGEVESQDQPSYTVRGGELRGQRVAQVSLTRPATSIPAEVQLVVRIPSQAMGGERGWRMTGFRVVEAARWSGFLGVALSGDWTLQWSDAKHLAPSDEFPEPIKKLTNIKTGFELFRDDYQLTLTASAKQTHLSAEPTYLVQVEPNVARLEAVWRFRVRGAKAHFVDIDLAGWEWDTIAPETAFDLDAIGGSNKPRMRVPLLIAEGGQFELTLRAHRDLPAGAAMNLPLPSVDAQSVSAGMVTIRPAENVQLTPRSEQMPLLLTEGVAAPAEEGTGPVTFTYRTRPDAKGVEFVAEREILRRRVQTGVVTRLRVMRSEVVVEQQWNFRVLHEPLTELRFRMPAELAASRQANLTFNGKSLAWTLDAPSDETTGTATAPKDGQFATALLPSPMQGSFAVAWNYVIPLQRNGAQVATDQKLSFVVPTDVEWDEHRLSIVDGADFKGEVNDDRWMRNDAQSSPESATYTASGGLDGVNLRVTTAAGPQAAELRVEKVWVQTWLSADERQERVVWRLATRRPTLRIALPAEVPTDDVDVLLNGAREFSRRVVGDHVLQVELSEAARQNDIVLEVWYRFQEGRPAKGRMLLQAARLEEPHWIRRGYWQLIVPEDEHLLAVGSPYLSESQWRWNQLFWSPAGSWEQSQLEDWIGASRQEAVPTATHRYLFSVTGEMPSLEATSWDRRGLILIASGFVLAVGLLFLYWPVLRHPLVIVAMGVVLATLALIQPPLAILIAQTAALGTALLLVACGLEWLYTRRRVERPAPPTAGSTAPHPMLEAVLVENPSDELRTTETVPLVTHGSSRRHTTSTGSSVRTGDLP